MNRREFLRGWQFPFAAVGSVLMGGAGAITENSRQVVTSAVDVEQIKAVIAQHEQEIVKASIATLVRNKQRGGTFSE